MAAKQKKTTYTAAEVAVLEETILKQKDEISELKRKLEHMNEVFANAQRARFGQSREKASCDLPEEQISLFNEAEKELNPERGSKLADAVTYTKNQTTALTAIVEHGDVPISNNLAENAIRPFDAGRKNWLFSDTVKGCGIQRVCNNSKTPIKE